MKKATLSMLMVLGLTAGAAMAQSTLNTTAPGPSQEKDPGQTNNNLQNPGSNMTPRATNKPVTENGTVEGTAVESNQRTGTDSQNGTTGTTTGSSTYGSGSATGSTTGSTTGSYSGSSTSSSTDVDTTGGMSTGSGSSRSGRSLPKTGSELPLVALLGMAALAGSLALRASRRNA